METIDNYTLLKVVGKGSFAKVYLAKDNRSGEQVAIKQVMFKESSEKDKISALNQVRLLASFQHQNIINFKSAFFNEQTQTMYIVMQYASKGDISNKIDYLKMNKRYLNQNEIWKFIKQITQALKVLHENNIIHRDIKSANIFVTSEGNYKIADFNVSKLVKCYQGLAQTRAGTPLYASPQIWGTQGYNNKSDIWSLGIVTYELCALQLPYPANSFAQLTRKIVKGKFNRIPVTFSDDLHRMICSMLNRVSSKRPTADQIIQTCESHLTPSINKKLITKQKSRSKKFSMIETIHNPMQLQKLYFHRLSYQDKIKTEQNQTQRNESQIQKSISSMLQPSNNQNSHNPIITIKDRVRSFYKAKDIPPKRQRVSSIKQLPPKRQQVALKPLVLNLNIDAKKNVPFTERNQNAKNSRRFVRLPSLNGNKNPSLNFN